MIIGIDASRANRQHRSGTEWYSLYLIKEIAKIDSENQYILYTDKPLENDLLNLIDDSIFIEQESDKNGYIKLKSPHNNFKAKILAWPFNFFWTQGRLSLEMLLHKPDVLFVPSHTLPILHPKNSVITIHDVGFERDHSIYKIHQIGPDRKKSKLLLNAIVKFMTSGQYGANSLDYLTWSTIYGLKNAKEIITVSNFSADEMRDIYKNKVNSKIFEKISVVYNGYNSDKFKTGLATEKINTVLRKHNLKKPYIFYLGRIERKKNIPRLIEAFSEVVKKYPNIKLVLTGTASFGYDEVKYLISEFGLEENVIKTGWIEENDLPYLYAGAELFIFPSLYEGFGIPLIEAMACGTPVCCSNASAITEIVDGAAHAFDALNQKDMSDKIIEILNNDELKKSLSDKGLERVKAFNWKLTATETLKVITKK